MIKDPTCTSLVLEELSKADDFRNMRQLCEYTRCTHNQVSAALSHLKAYKAVDFVSNPDGTWWFATPETDTRHHIKKQRVHEIKPRKTRKVVKK